MDIQTILSNLKIDQLNAMQEASIDAWKEGSDLILLSPTGSGKTKPRIMDIQTILSNLKIDQLNAMQEASIDAWKEGSDLILLSPTGSGKTLAYLLPLVSSLKKGVEGVQAVVLVPSRELALQIEQVFKAMATGFPVMSCYGGRPAMEEHRTMKGISPAVIIGTPGRMNDHLNKQNFEAGTVRTLVIDEFDKCLEFGFQDEMAEVIGKLPALRRRFLLSATDAEEIPRFTGMNRTLKLDFLNQDEMAEVIGKLPALRRRFLLSATDAEEIPRFTGMNRTLKLDFLNPEEPVSQRLSVYRVTSPVKDKLETLYKLLCTLGNESTLVFCNHRESVDRVALQAAVYAGQRIDAGVLQSSRECGPGREVPALHEGVLRDVPRRNGAGRP